MQHLFGDSGERQREPHGLGRVERQTKVLVHPFDRKVRGEIPRQDGRRLRGDQQESFLTIQSFLAKAREALSARDVQRAFTLADKAYLLAPAGAEGPGFLMLQNFRVIMKYNPAEAYALAIGHFADRLRGGAPFVQPWPRQERVLSRAERLELQQLLAQRGFYRGTPDGQFGGETREALRGFQASIGAPADGFASSDVLERLRGR